MAAPAPVPAPVAVQATPLQRDVLLDALAGPAAALHIEQLHWRWYGPLDPHRFTAAWQSVFDRESVLRAAVADPLRGTWPRIAVHPHAAPHITRHTRGAVDWQALLVSERRREFDLRRPGPLRIAVLDEGPAIGPVARVLITYHQALLDRRSLDILLSAFYRAYLADGRPHGGERRPDLRDHRNWLSAQDLGPARSFWSAAAPPRRAVTLPARLTGRLAGRLTARPGHGRTRERLRSHEALRLREWAVGCGAAESTVLHAAWALLLHRAAAGPDPGPTPVAFSVAVSGRGIPLEGVASLPAPLRNPLPLSVDVDPAATVAQLLAALGGRALDMASYEWVSAGQIHTWAGRSPYEDGLTESVLSFEAPPQLRPGRPGRGALHQELAAQGIRVERPEAVGPHTAAPLTLAAHYDTLGELVLTAVHDRTRIADEDAAAVLAQTARLLRGLPAAGRSATVADALALLDGDGVPAMAARPADLLTTLRQGAHPGAGTVCLLPPADAPPGCYDRLAASYPGPEALTTVAAPADASACLRALRPVLATGEPLLLGCFLGTGGVAYEVADRIAAHGWDPPAVAVAGRGDGSADAARELALALGSAARSRAAH
ncbi:condensation domain-containing protein [Streptomyces sp. NBC_00503]|uniref:condensation domain-containing protein n=1 Tax=Streptomyces sp. NBC_00503 TaxID=2903659 RepID=UPI002E80C3C7|nr:condensation domain-containing protein [Streptomyces sp. NBC_00503]WUD86582.1 condensation domain-containing protein [Streptomyces sp. NBC_00503]